MTNRTPVARHAPLCRWTTVGCLSLAVAVTVIAADPATRPAGRSVDTIRAELDRVTPPKRDASAAKDSEQAAAFEKAFKTFLADRAALIGELLAAAPTTPQAEELIVERWRALGQLGRGTEAAEEIKTHFAADTSRSGSATYFAAILEIDQIATTDADRAAALERYAQRGGKEPLPLLLAAAGKVSDVAIKSDLLRQVIVAAPNSPQAEAAEGQLRQLDRIGKPLELAFADVVTGKPVSVAGLKGKVVVIDFWATWCGPCRALIPELRELYAARHDKGLEIISVSLDDSGDEPRAKLLKVIADTDMPWHHYYQGDGFDGAFSKSWGIDSIPRLFVIDRAGNLVTGDGRQNLTETVDALLKN